MLPLLLAQQTTMSDWVVVGIVIVAALLAATITRRLVRSIAEPLRLEPYVASIVSRVLTIVIALVALAFVLGQIDVEVGPLLGALGISGIIIAMALQPVLGNLVGALLLHARRPIKPGDQIHSNGHAGTVIDITGRAVVLVTFDGETVFLPNLKVLEEPLLNQTASPYRRTVLPFQVSYDANLRDTARAVAKAIRTVEALGEAPPGDVFVTGFGDSGVDLAAQVWHPSEELSARFAISEVAITIRETLAANGVEIPFPQRVLHLRSDLDNALSEKDPDVQ